MPALGMHDGRYELAHQQQVSVFPFMTALRYINHPHIFLFSTSASNTLYIILQHYVRPHHVQLARYIFQCLFFHASCKYP